MNPTQRIVEILEKVPFSLLLLLYLGYLGFGYYQFMNDDGSPLHLKQMEVTAAREEVRKLEKRVKEVNDFMQSLAAKKQQLRELAQELEDTKATLSDNLNVSDFINTISTESARSGIKFIHLNPSGSNKYEYYESQDFFFDSSGVFFQYLAFLDRLASLQKIIRISKLKITPTGAPDSPFVKLNATMTISVYRYIGTKADELGKGDASADAPNAPKSPGAGAVAPISPAPPPNAASMPQKSGVTR
ncbi:MAG: type 4a pilus biogenesis protein PilO [Oligoflexia bacterium]|nr:type 4a pilus biogenesis protein PilO [Oligoflexia bacterium]